MSLLGDFEEEFVFSLLLSASILGKNNEIDQLISICFYFSLLFN